MEISHIELGRNVRVDPTTSLNNVRLSDNVKIAKYCSVFGSQSQLLEIGQGSYVGMFSILNGYAQKLVIGAFVSIAQNVNIMTDSGPNASEFMQQFYPLTSGEVSIGDHAWIGAGVVIMPGVTIGRCSIIAANSFVATHVPAYCLYGGNPARKIKSLDQIAFHDR